MAKKFPDLNKDGKVTQADVLKGRGVFNDGGLSDVEKVMRIVRGMSMSEAKAETPEQAEKAKQQGQRLLDTFDESVLRKAYQRIDAERDDMAMGGSLMVAPEREMYGKGKLVKKLVGALKDTGKKVDANLEKKLYEKAGITENTPGVIATQRGAIVGLDKVKAFGDIKTQKGAIYTAPVAMIAGSGIADIFDAFDGNKAAMIAYAEANDNLPTDKEASDFEKAFSQAFKTGEDTWRLIRRSYPYASRI